MDPEDPTSLLFTKIRTLEPEYASKIIGYVFLHDLSSRDLMRLAHGSDTLLQSVCLKAKSALGLSSNVSSSASTPLNPISRPINIHGHSLSQSSPRTSGNGLMEFSRNPFSSSSLTSGSVSSNPNMISSPFQPSSSLFGSSSVPDGTGEATGNGDLLDEQHLGNYFSFLNDSSSRNEEGLDPYGFSDNNGDSHLHRRSFSASDVCLGSEEQGFGGGYRFPHGGVYGDDFDSYGGFGSPSKMDYVCRQQEEMTRMKLAHRQRMAAAQFMAATGSPMSYEKGINFLLHSRNAHRSGPGQFGEEGYWYGSPGRHEREDFMGMGDKCNSASRQIYLTFPADSSFTDDDVSNYFSNFGPVQDVRIPYQQKRMFGFVTFVHAETVRAILARGNPHFICDSRVLVKPYKEKGKVLEKRQQQQLQQQMERGNFSPCSSPSGMDSRDLFDCHMVAPRMFSNTQEMLRRKAEQVDLQQAIEFQRKRFLNLQLPNMENESFNHHQRSLSIGSPSHFTSRNSQSLLFRSENAGEEFIEGNGDSGESHFHSESNRVFLSDNDHTSSQERGYSNHVNKGQETSMENFLPDSLFASPSKTGETRDPETEKEKGAAVAATAENKPASPDQSA